MKNKKIITGLPCLLFATVCQLANAQDSIHGNVGLSYTQWKYGDFLKEKTYTPEATIYFSPVKKRNHPWKEAAFLERAGSVDIAAGLVKQDYTDSYSGSGPSFSLGGTYASPDHPIILTASASRRNLSLKEEIVSNDVTDTELSFGGGTYIGSNLAIAATYTKYKNKNKISIFGQNAGTLEVKSKQYDLYAKYVLELPSQSAFGILANASSGKVDYFDGDGYKYKIFSIRPEYYINSGTSIALKLENYKDDDQDRYWRYELGLHKFIGPRFSLDLNVYKIIVKDPDNENSNGFNIKGAFWF